MTRERTRIAKLYFDDVSASIFGVNLGGDEARAKSIATTVRTWNFFRLPAGLRVGLLRRYVRGMIFMVRLPPLIGTLLRLGQAGRHAP